MTVSIFDKPRVQAVLITAFRGGAFTGTQHEDVAPFTLDILRQNRIDDGIGILAVRNQLATVLIDRRHPLHAPIWHAIRTNGAKNRPVYELPTIKRVDSMAAFRIGGTAAAVRAAAPTAPRTTRTTQSQPATAISPSPPPAPEIPKNVQTSPPSKRKLDVENIGTFMITPGVWSKEPGDTEDALRAMWDKKNLPEIARLLGFFSRRRIHEALIPSPHVIAHKAEQLGLTSLAELARQARSGQSASGDKPPTRPRRVRKGENTLQPLTSLAAPTDPK